MLKAKQHHEEKPQVQATNNILHPADKPQASFQWSCGPLERETWMESMLPAQLGTVLDMAGGFPFKGREQQKLREQLGQEMFHTHGSKLNHPSLADVTKINECPRLHEKKYEYIYMDVQYT